MNTTTISFKDILEGANITLKNLKDNIFAGTIGENILKTLSFAKLIPVNGKLLSTSIRGTTYADGPALEQLHKDFLLNKDPKLDVALEPGNPKPPAFKVTYQGKPIGYLPAELSRTLAYRAVTIAGVLDILDVNASKKAYRIDVLVGYGPQFSAKAPPQIATPPPLPTPIPVAATA